MTWSAGNFLQFFLIIGPSCQHEGQVFSFLQYFIKIIGHASMWHDPLLISCNFLIIGHPSCQHEVRVFWFLMIFHQNNNLCLMVSWHMGLFHDSSRTSPKPVLCGSTYFGDRGGPRTGPISKTVGPRPKVWFHQFWFGWFWSFSGPKDRTFKH